MKEIRSYFSLKILIDKQQNFFYEFLFKILFFLIINYYFYFYFNIINLNKVKNAHRVYIKLHKVIF